MIEISVVVPVFNSEENLNELCRQLDDALISIDHEIIFVNDGSQDNSWSEIKNLTIKYPSVLGINLRKNVGQDNAIMAGLSYAQGNYIIIMDDDLQHSPYDILILYKGSITCDADICFANFKKTRQLIWKNVGSSINGKFSEWLLRKPSHIYLSPFKIIKKEVIQEIIKYTGPYPYIDGLLLSVTNNMVQVDIEHHHRFKGKSNYNFTRSISVFLRHITTFSIVPLRVSSTIGILCSILGFLLIPYYLIDYFLLDIKVEGWITLVILLLIIGGMILLSLGIIGEYLGRTYLNINRNPQFTIKETTQKT